MYALWQTNKDKFHEDLMALNLNLDIFCTVTELKKIMYGTDSPKTKSFEENASRGRICFTALEVAARG